MLSSTIFLAISTLGFFTLRLEFWETGPISEAIGGRQLLSLVLNFVRGCLSNLYLRTYFVLR